MGVLQLEIISPYRMVLSDKVDEAVMPGAHGSLGVLPDHTPYIAALRPGEFWYRKGESKEYLFVGGGYAEILPDRVIILSEVVEKSYEIDFERAKLALERAESHLSGKEEGDIDFERARIALERAIIRMQVASRK